MGITNFIDYAATNYRTASVAEIRSYYNTSIGSHHNDIVHKARLLIAYAICR